MSRRLLFAALAAVLSLVYGCATSGYQTKPRVAVVDSDPIVQMTSGEKFPTLVDPAEVPLRRHSDPPFKNEEAVGRSDLTPPRIYPIGLLDTYEVVNDAGGGSGSPYVVARCALTDLVAVYDRRVDGQTLTFENSGALWRDMLVMRDRETGTYWTPANGRALYGPLAGKTLAGIPAPLAKTADWGELDPDLLCLDTGEMTAVPLQLRIYKASNMEGLSGEKKSDARYPPKARVYYVADGDTAAAISAEELRKRKTWATTVSGRMVTFEWDAGLRAPRAFVPAEGESNAAARREVPVIPIFWFAAVEHFKTVETPKGAAK